MSHHLVETDIMMLTGKRGLSYLNHILKICEFNEPKHIVEISYHTMRMLSENGKNGIKAHPALSNLEKRWYASLPHSPDYSVYHEDCYIAEVWCCWDFYARKYLGDIFKPNKIQPHGLLHAMGEGLILDVGNGLGMVTAAMKQLFPMRQVYGTNLPDTSQWKINQHMAKTYKYNLLSNEQMLNQLVGNQIALIFASEYFEHFESPIDHLEELMTLKPGAWVIANAFNADSIGHFDYYKVDGKTVDCKEIGRIFGQTMRKHGYQSAKTTFWNNRPAVWIRQD